MPYIKTFHSIILIEDNDEHFDMLTAALKRTSFKDLPIERAASLEAARELCREVAFAQKKCIMLCDQSLPDSDPEHTLDEMMRIAPPKCVVLAMTSINSGELAQRVIRAGAQDYLIKGEDDPKRLDRSIRSAIERKTLMDQIVSVNNDLDAFTRIVSHDLKSPIAVMRLEIDELSRNPELNQPELKRALTSLTEECQTMQEIIDSLLSYARASWAAADAGTIMPEEAVADALSQLRKTREFGDASIKIEPLPQAFGSPRALTQVFKNLIENGVKYNKQDLAVITVSGEEHEDAIRIRVKDNGPGIPNSLVPKIYQMGTRGNTEKPGSGLGLAIAKRLAQAQGGDLVLESTSTTGSTFLLTLKPPPPGDEDAS